MFRFISSILLLIAFAIQSFHMGGIVVDYYLNTAAYAKYCENKAKPVLKCNGQCQMAKKILEKQKKEEQAPERKWDSKVQIIWFKVSFASVASYSTIPSHTYSPYLDPPKSWAYLGSIFHPPCLV